MIYTKKPPTFLLLPKFGKHHTSCLIMNSYPVKIRPEGGGKIIEVRMAGIVCQSAHNLSQVTKGPLMHKLDSCSTDVIESALYLEKHANSSLSVRNHLPSYPERSEYSQLHFNDGDGYSYSIYATRKPR